MIGLLRACTGLIAWAVIFSLLYAVEGMGCAQRWNPALLRVLLAAIWLGGAFALAILAWRWRAPTRAPLTDQVAAWLAAVGFAATLITGAPVATLSLCL